MHSPKLSPEAVSRVSKACAGFALWIHAVYDYRSAALHATAADADAAPAPLSTAALETVDEEAEVALDAPPRRALLSIVNKNDLHELRSLAKPPEGVAEAAAAALLLLGHEDTSWMAAQKALAARELTPTPALP